jgi:hypothetical protein
MSDTANQLVITINQIVITGGVLAGGIGLFIRFYVKSIGQSLRENWNKEITETRTSMTYEFEKEMDTIKKEITTSAIKSKVKDYIDTEQRILGNDLRTIKEAVLDTRALLTTQQEQLLVIQTGFTEMKPKIMYMEERIKKVEDKIDNYDTKR